VGAPDLLSQIFRQRDGFLARRKDGHGAGAVAMLAQLRVAKLDVVDVADTRLQNPAQERLELGQVMQNSRDSPCDEVLRSKPLLQVEP
jgi:hypothetical protein